MTKEEFAYWQTKTESSRHTWTEDTIFRLNGRGAFYYIGGENGQYIEIGKNGLLEVGKYESAFPHIGEAFFTVQAKRQCKDFDEAFKTAVIVGGKKFLADMFSSGEPVLPSSNKKPSILNGIKETQQTVRVQDDIGQSTNKREKNAEL